MRDPIWIRRHFNVACAALALWGIAGSATAQSPAPAKTVLVVGDSLSAEYGLRRGSGWVSLLEQRLASEPETGTFCHGHTPTFADICLASIVVMTRLFKIELPELPNVQRIMAACEQLDAFARAAPGLQAGAPTA